MRRDEEVVVNPVKQSGLCALGSAGAGVRAVYRAGLAPTELPAGRKTSSKEGCFLAGHLLPPATSPHVTASMGPAALCMVAGAKTLAWTCWAEQSVYKGCRELWMVPNPTYFPSHERSDARQGGENPSAWVQTTSSQEPPTFSETPKPFHTSEQQWRLQNHFPKLSEKQWIIFFWFIAKYWACSSYPYIQLCYSWDNPGVTLTRKLASC